nr:15830_t:CDS:1 [Entrophospora candida]CAG8629994.1 11928_t:CDS:1 [Entrophospora candida]
MSAKDLINSKINIDNKYLETLFKQVSERTAQDRYKDISQEELFPFTQEKRIPFPLRLQEIVDWENIQQNVDVHCLFGCFPYTKFVYFVLDYNLFIWDYENSNSNNEAAIGHIDIHPQQDKKIKSVGLVKPRPGRWVDNAQYVLVIATDKSVYVFGLSVTKNNEEITFHDMSSLKYISDYSGRSIDSIVGTDNGRIFLIDDGELCELIYDDEGWFNKPCRLEIHSLNLISSTLRFVNGGFSNFKSCIVDDTHKMVYAMSTNRIEAYHMLDDGKTLKSVGSYSLKDAVSGGPSLKGKLVSIHPTYNTNSHYFWLMAVTSVGYRGYFTCHRDFSRLHPDSQKSTEPNGLFLVEVHQLPHGLQQHQKVYQSFNYFHGNYFALNRNNSSYYLTYTSPNHGAMFLKFIQNKDPTFSEYYFSVTFRNIYAMEEIHHFNYNPKNFIEYSNDLIGQFILPQRKFLIYTSAGIQIWVKKRPVEHLKEILLKNQQNLLKDFIRNHGLEQTCAMCFLIGNDQSHQFLQNFKENSSQLQEALAFCLSRILRPVWNQRILKKSLVKSTSSGAIEGKIDLNVTSEVLNDVHQKLIKLKAFFHNHFDYITLSSQINTSASFSATTTTTAQNNPIAILFNLMIIMADAISFVLLMFEYDLSDIITNISESSKKLLFDSTYEDLVTAQQVRNSWHDLVLVIIKKESSLHENLTRNLEIRCSTFFNASEAKMYRGYEALQKAKKSENELSKDNALKNSLKLFNDSINVLTYGNLINLCQEYKNLGFYEGALELLLKAAQTLNSEPDKKTSIIEILIKTLRDADVFADSITFTTSSPQLQKYNLLLQKTLNLATSLNDKDFLFALYDEFLITNSMQLLFDPPAPFLEEYFTSIDDDQSSPLSIISRRKLELYCDFCAKHHEYLKAANVQEFLALKPGNDISLQDRLHYLCHAVGLVESIKELNLDENIFDILQKYHSELKIAQIQYDILQDILKIPDDDYNFRAASRSLPNKIESTSLLNQQIFGAKTLLDEYAIPFKLVERQSALTQYIAEVNL